MKIRTAMKSKVDICDIKSEGCLATKMPNPVELLYVGPQEQETCACSVCLKKKLMAGDWSMWYWEEFSDVAEKHGAPQQSLEA